MKWNLLRSSTSGEFEITRVLGAIGVLTYIVGAHAFLAYDIIWKGSHFDVTAYCLAFPSGLGVAVGVIVTAAGVKDRNVAAAQATQAATAAVQSATGAQP